MTPASQERARVKGSPDWHTQWRDCDTGEPPLGQQSAPDTMSAEARCSVKEVGVQANDRWRR